MTRRAAANAETRRRIVDAAIALHGERGILGTSWPDIAKRADVALGTVYRYFPSLDQLVPACTSENAARVRPPGAGILVGLTRPAERIGRFVQELFASPVPTVVYVAPSGATATSAGCFVTLAADVAAT